LFNILLLLKDVSEHPLWKEQIKSRIALRDINLKVWMETNLFSIVWWFMLILFFGLWFLWWKLVDKTRLLEIIAYGLMVTVLTSIIDVIAVDYNLWGYPNKLIPVVPPLLLDDLCLFPVIYMLIYQYFPSWKSFSIAMSFTALLLAIVVGPIAVWLDIFQLNKWKYIYFFPLYFFIAIILKWIMEFIKQKQDSYRNL
jgi:hypothetical protein